MFQESIQKKFGTFKKNYKILDIWILQNLNLLIHRVSAAFFLSVFVTTR